MAPTKNAKKLQKNMKRNEFLKELKKGCGPNNNPPPELELISHTKVLTMGLVQQDLDGLQSWVCKKRGQEGIFYIKEEISQLKERRDRLLVVENDSLSEKQITTSVPVRLRPGFPAEFRTFAKFGRKEGMRGKPTYFYSMELVRENWPAALEAGQQPVRSSTRARVTEAEPQAEHRDNNNDAENNICQTTLGDVVRNELRERVDNRNWEDIAGRNFTKNLIREAAVWPLLRPDLFTGLRSVPKIIMFSGPGSVAKKLLAECIAAETSSSFFKLPCSSLLNKWSKQGKDLLHELFKEAKRQQPSVIFVEEVESILWNAKEDSYTLAIKSAFRYHLEKVQDAEKVLVVLAILKPEKISESERRLFGRSIIIPLPDQEDRLQILTRLLSKDKLDVEDEQMELISFLTEGFTETNLVMICKKAAREPIKSAMNYGPGSFEIDLLRPIEYRDLQKAVDEFKDKSDLQDDEVLANWENN